MLKIKDNVDLKELEKYGFKYYRMLYVKDNLRNEIPDLIENKKIYIEEESRNISIGAGLFNADIELDTLYDLIKADLVEKVDDLYE